MQTVCLCKVLLCKLVHHGPPTILVNNAGVHLKKPAVETRPDEFEAVLRTHLTAAHDLSRLVLPGMLERRHGNILFIASMASFFGVPKVIAYAAAKSAYLGMVRTLAAEVSGDGVRVNAIAPGWIETPMLAPGPRRRPRAQRQDPRPHPDEQLRPARGHRLGRRLPLLARRRFVTGAVLPVDGGASIGF